MIHRRDFIQSATALAGLGAFGTGLSVHAQGKRVFRAANPVGVVDAQQAFVTCGRHPKLRYYES